jgi:uncharacterized membrane protein
MFPRSTLAAVEEALASAQRVHTGVIRFVVEPSLPTRVILSDIASRTRACQIFAMLRVWDTASRNGVLVHIVAADRSLEIVADRGVSQCVARPDWEAVCHLMEGHFGAGRFEAGAIAAVDAISGLLARHFPAEASANPGPASRGGDPLPHQPSLL